MNDKNELKLIVERNTVQQDDSDSVRLVRRLFGIGREDQTYSLDGPIKVQLSGITMILGRSGSGKSSVLNQVSALVPDAIVVSEGLVREPAQPLVDLLPLPTAESIRMLGKMGLGEARLLVTPYQCLSTGQQVRAQLAIGIASDASVLIIDEFVAALDRMTARFIAYNLQRECRQRGKILFLATSHEDLCDVIAPDAVFRISLDGEVEQLTSNRVPELKELSAVTVHDGTRDDYYCLERFHYIQNLAAESPMTDSDWNELITDIRTAKYGDERIGVLICSRPLSKNLDGVPFFGDLNKSVLVFHRTIVHPGYRGIGIASRFLLPAHHPDHRIWLSCSAMGQYLPFRTAAGFEKIEHPRNARFEEHDQLETIIQSELSVELDSLHDHARFNQAFLGAKNEVRTQLRTLSKKIMVRYNVSYCRFLAYHAEVETHERTWASLEKFFNQALDQVNDDIFGSIASECLHLPVQGFIRRVRT